MPTTNLLIDRITDRNITYIIMIRQVIDFDKFVSER